MPPTNFDKPFRMSGSFTSVTQDSDTSNATSSYELAIPDTYRVGPVTKNVHGGAVAMFFDNATCVTLLACRNADEWAWSATTGVSRSLSVTYLNPAVVGESVVIESEVVQLTRRLATIKAVLRRKEGGELLAMCTHERYNPYSRGDVKL